MKTIIKSITVLLIAAVVFTSCKKESVQVTPPPLSGNRLAEYDLDITLNTTYKFLNNVSDAWGYAISATDYDLTEIRDKVNLSGLGVFDIYVMEYADTAISSDELYADFIEISQASSLYISGNHSLNFKKLIREGGGAFNGTLKITRGSVQYLNRNIFSSLPPLNGNRYFGCEYPPC
ncbi:MAG: hypothetical protein WKF85_10345 [Chitinophagaceae bacterium]